MLTHPFNPVRGGTVTAAPNNTNVNTSFPVATPGAAPDALLVVNAGAALAFVRVQNTEGAVAASPVDTPILPNSAGILRIGFRAESFTVSVFSAAATTVYLTPGEGGV